MKSGTQSPRIVEVATQIATIQSRQAAIEKRLGVLANEMSKLKSEFNGLELTRLAAAREMDKLTA